MATIDDLRWWNAQPFLEYFGAVGRVATWNATSHVGVVHYDAEESDPLPILEDGLEHEDVVEVASPRIGVIVGQDVTRMDVVPKIVETSLQRWHCCADMNRQGQGDTARCCVDGRVMMCMLLM